jgi:hypothetical protein
MTQPSIHIWSRIRAALASPSLQRLENMFPIFRVELKAFEESSTTRRAVAGSLVWAEQAKALFGDAEEAVKARNAERGWRCLKAADRSTWYGLGAFAPDLLAAATALSSH